MVSVTQLAQFLLNLNPQGHAARICFYHWIKNFLDLNAPLNSGMIDQFYSYALLHSYWQTHQKVLGETVSHDLNLFSQSHTLDFNPQKIRHSHQMQIVELTETNDALAIIEQSLTTESGSEKAKIMNLGAQRILTIQATAQQGIIIQVFSLLAQIQGAQLKPLSPLTRLIYNSRLDLMPGAVQILQTGHSNWSRFQTDEDQCYGQLITGYTFQKSDQYSGKHMGEYPELFYGLKRLERYYIDLKSDPLYQELISLLENALNLVGSNHPEAHLLAENALKKGRLALKNIFLNDRLLQLLISNLEYRMADHQRKSEAVFHPTETETPCPDFPLN